MRKLQTTLDNFTLQPEDTEQIAGYVEGLLQEYPQARVARVDFV